MPTALSNYTQEELDVAAVVVFVVSIGAAAFFYRRCVKIWRDR